MKTFAVSNLAELETALATLDPSSLFRGQINHFVNDGAPSVVTSFDRKGCIPSRMLKWSRYADSVIGAYIDLSAVSTDFTQALLQHFGWRSFFVDCSSSAAVAAWFASHTYHDKSRVELSEDCEEDPVMLVKRMARYELEDGTGHLYVFDKEQVAELIGAIDLSVLAIDGYQTRTSAQQAWLLGPIRKSEVPLEGFRAHISAPRVVLSEYAAKYGFKSTSDLFPPIDKDPILATLLRLPWKLIDHPENTPDSIQFFERALDIPEYDDSFQKIAAKGVAFYKGASVAERDSIDGVKNGGVIVKVPEIVLFGTADEAPLKFVKVLELIAEHGAAAFEIDDLFLHAPMRGSMLYQKGVVAILHEPDLVELGELMVEHPGLSLTSAGLVPGWFYRVADDGVWSRVIHADQCDCGNEEHHLRHVSALHIVEEFLTNPEQF